MTHFLTKVLKTGLLSACLLVYCLGARAQHQWTTIAGNQYLIQKKNPSSQPIGKLKPFKPDFSPLILKGRKAGLNNKISPEQDFSVNGQVTSEEGEPLPGVNVTVQGTTQGTVTDVNGNYSLSAPENGTLVFSFVGYSNTQVQVNGRSTIDVELSQDVTELDEVVVVGYGTQRKENLTGSVSSVQAEDLVKRPVQNPQNLLQGKVSGLQVTQQYGIPGDAQAQMRIRGMGTFSSAGNEPLVLIDGVPGNMRNLDPENIEEISVLKDAASSAIYGARAANGVILIQTKEKRGQELTVDYSVNFNAQEATRLPNLLTNSAQYMELWNQANERAGQPPWFSDEDIQAFRNNPDDPENYPNFDWIDHSFETAFAQKHNLSIGGGTEKTSFNLSAGYWDQEGIVGIYDFQKYNVLLSLDSDVNDWINVGGKIRGVKRDRVGEHHWNWLYILSAYGAGPNFTPTMTLPDGSEGYVARYSKSIGEWTVRNPDALAASGSRQENQYGAYPQLYLNINPIENLTWRTRGAMNFDFTDWRIHEHHVNNYFFKSGDLAHRGATHALGTEDRMSTERQITFYSTLEYDKEFNEMHNLKILGGYEQQYFRHDDLMGKRIYFPTTTLKELDAGSTREQSTGGSAYEWAIRSYFGRLNYDFKNKYLLEANLRYDGTSRIHPDNRWGLFPSVSAGWRMSEENFLDNSWLDNLKLRASWGQLGNQNVGTYPYQSILNLTSYAFSSIEQGVTKSRMVDKSLQWETTSVTDVGIDFSMQNGLFSLTADWFHKFTEGILYTIPIPSSVGLSAPTVNGGEMKNVGWEFELGHKNEIGPLSYDVSFNFSTYENEVVNIISPSYGTTTVQEGLPYGSFYLIEWDKIFQSQSEIDEAADHPFGPKPGDLRYKDKNGDGTINSDDRKVVDGAFPDFQYGGEINLFWKNFNLTAFFQGVEGRKTYMGSWGWGYRPFVQGSPPRKEFVENRWTPENPTNENPAIYRGADYGPVSGTNSTYWLFDASYLRLKNLVLGYSLPSEICQNIGLNNLGVFLSGDNLVTFTDYARGLDPESVSSTRNSANFPQLTTYSLGLKVGL